MTNSKTKRPPPLSLRLTPDERRQLENEAAGMSLGGYIRVCVFGEKGSAIKKRAQRQFRIKDHNALAEVLAKLGASRLASNLNQLAKAANSGSLPVTPETESALQAACQDIRAIKRLLMTALGIRER